jgi:hypothetical protein
MDWIWIEMTKLDRQSKSKIQFWFWIVNHNPIHQIGLQSRLSNPTIQSSNTLLVGPKSVKIQLSHKYLFTLSGSASVKAVHKTLMKLSPYCNFIKVEQEASVYARRFNDLLQNQRKRHFRYFNFVTLFEHKEQVVWLFECGKLNGCIRSLNKFELITLISMRNNSAFICYITK